MYELKNIKSYYINTVDMVTTIFKFKYFVTILISFSRLENNESHNV